MTTTLEERDGTVFLAVTDGDGNRERRRLGEVDDPEVACLVPAEMFREYIDLVEDYFDAVAFGRACRAEAEATYARNLGSRFR